jgi:hypothetical protein
MMYQFVPSDWTMIALVPPNDPGELNDTVLPPSTVATPLTLHPALPMRLMMNTRPVFADAEGRVIVFVLPLGLSHSTV